jgi:hypothetical protein
VILISIPGRGKRLIFLENFQIFSVAHLAFYSMGKGGNFSRGKAGL